MAFFSFFNLNSKRGQFAVEYLLVTAFLFMLLLPSIYILYNYSLQSQEQMALARANEVGYALTANAEKVYYYGSGSKLTLQLAMPSLVTSFYYRCIDKGQPCEIVFDMGENSLGFTTPVPLEMRDDCQIDGIFKKCPFGVTLEDQERFRAGGPKTIVIEHKDNDKVDIKIE